MYDYNSFWVFLMAFIAVIMGTSMLVNWVFRKFFLQREQEE